MTRSAAIARGLRLGTPVALFAVALAVRAAGWREVLLPRRVVPVGADAYYHLRRIAVALFGSSGIPERDPYLSFPDGAKPIWTPTFDRLVATAVRPFVADDLASGQLAMERLAVWVPPLLGALTVVAAFALTRRHFGFGSGALAGAILCVLSGHYWYSQIGFLDHHAAVALLATLLLAAGLALVTRPGGRAGAAAAVGVGALAAASLQLWPGSLLHVGLVELGLLLFLLTRRDRDGARALATKLAVAHALAAILLAPAGLSADWPQWGAYSPVVLSRFQPAAFALAAGVTAACALAWRREALGAERGRRALALVVLAGVALALALALAPGIADGLGDAVRWAARAEAFQARVAESGPLLFEGGRFTLRIALVRLSGFVLLFPLAAVWLLVRPPGAAPRAATGLLLLFTAGLLVMTLVQKRFFNSASVGLAIVMALTGRALWDAARSPGRRAAAVAAGLVLIAPTFEPFVRPLQNELRALRGEPVGLGGSFAASRATLEVADWLRTDTEPTSGWLGGGEPPEYGVLAPWPLGHVIVYVGRRPTVVGNFGDDLGPEAFRFADRAYRLPEDAVLPGLEARRVRYVVARRSPGFLSAPPRPDGLLPAMMVHDGAGSSGEGPDALEHHRLVFESRGLRWSEADAEAIYKVFERVEGAVVEGHAAPGATIGVRLGLFTNRGRRVLYRRRVVADAAGRYRLRVPYATGASRPVRVAPMYRLACRGEVRGVAVGEGDVREGRRVAAPPLCLTPPGAPSGSGSGAEPLL